MSDQVIIAICTATPPTLMAALAWWKAKDVHKELNSREETRQTTIASNAASKAEGAKEEQEKSGAD